MAEKIPDKTKKEVKSKTIKTKEPLEIAIPYIDAKGEVGVMHVPKSLFGVEASLKLIALYNRVYLANQRKGTSKTLTRSEVRGSTRKIYKQKGTGRARHGARKAPIFVGGGVAHGPQLRPFHLKINKKQRQKALLYSLAIKTQAEGIRVMELPEGIKGKTKDCAVLLSNARGNDEKTLFVYSGTETERSFTDGIKNIDNVHLVYYMILNAYDVLNSKNIIFSKKALEDFIKMRENQ